MTIKFPDLSHYVPNVDISGYPALITKATEGTSYTDPTYKSYKAAAAGKPFAGYHFVGTQDYKAQAKQAFSVIGKSTPAMADVESGTSGSPSLAQTLNFIDAYRDLGGIMYLLYLPQWYWSGAWHGASLKPFVDRDMVLISSHYTTYSDNGPGWDSYGGMTPQIWQYTSTPKDMNAFKGTQDQLGNLFRNGNGEEDPMTPAEYLAILNDPSIQAYFKTKGWQYTGGGIDMASTLAALNAASHAASKADVAALAAQVKALSDKIDNMTPGTVAGDLNVTGTLHVTEA